MPARRPDADAPATPPPAPPADPRIAQVLEFWLGAAVPTDASALACSAQWFRKSAAFDEQVRTRFGRLIEAARAGALDGWAADALGRLALVLLLDQFTRNAYRGTPASFAGDAQALALAREGIANGHCAALAPLARTFLLLPLEHAEDPAMQAHSVAAFTQLAAQATPATQPLLASALDYAQQHQRLIARFGRFPHRNAILGRASTPAEQEYLAQPGAGF